MVFIFVPDSGDSASDLQAWQNCGKGFFVAIGGLLPEAEYMFENTQDAVDEVLKGLKNSDLTAG